MNEKQLRKVQLTNMALWGAAILLPIVARAFSSKDAKIFDILMPMWQFMLAAASTRMFGALQTTASKPQTDDGDAK